MLTHFLDNSQVYGSDDFTSNRLRLMKNGKNFEIEKLAFVKAKHPF